MLCTSKLKALLIKSLSDTSVFWQYTCFENFYDNHWRERGATNNDLKFCMKRFIDRSTSRFLLFLFQLHLLWTYSFFTSYFVILKFLLHVPIWVLPILGTHPFSGSYLPLIQLWQLKTTALLAFFLALVKSSRFWH